VIGESEGNGIFPEIRFADSFKPQCRSVGFETNHAKRGTGVQLPEPAVQTESFGGGLCCGHGGMFRHPTDTLPDAPSHFMNACVDDEPIRTQHGVVEMTVALPWIRVEACEPEA